MILTGMETDKALAPMNPADSSVLEDNDTRSAIEEGVNSGEAIDFDPAAHLKSLKASKRNA